MPFSRAVAALVRCAGCLCLIAASLQAQDSVIASAPQLPEIHGFIQIHFRAYDPLAKDGFRLRKADLKFSGGISPRLRWRIGFDAAKALVINKRLAPDDSFALADATIDQKTRMLQDAALTYTVNRTLQVDIGQQILPLSLEGGISTGQIETIERTMFINERSRAVGLGDVRDIGVAVNGLAARVVEYHVGLFNEAGEGAGTTDVNQQKTVVGRVALHPSFLPKFQIGGSGAFEGGPPLQHRERAAGEAQYKTATFTLRAEAMSARDGLLHRFGWYGLGVARPAPRVQLAARYDAWDRDRSGETSLRDAFERQITLGGSYLLDGENVKFALNVVRQSFPNVATVRSGTYLLAAFQGAW